MVGNFLQVMRLKKEQQDRWSPIKTRILLNGLGCLFLILSCYKSEGRQKSLQEELVAQDTNSVNSLIHRAYRFYFNKPDSCLYYAMQAAELAHKLEYSRRELEAYQIIGEAYRFMGDYPKSLESQQRAIELARKTGSKLQESYSYGFIGFTYMELNENRKGLRYLFMANEIYSQYDNPERSAFNLSNIGGAYLGLGILDSALLFLDKALVIAKKIDHKNLIVLTLRRLGKVKHEMGEFDEAMQIYYEALNRTSMSGDRVNPGYVQMSLAELHYERNQLDSCLYYARNALRDARRITSKPQMLQAAALIAQVHRDKNIPDSVLYYQDIVLAMKDSLFGAEKFRQLQVFALEEQQRQLDTIREQDQLKSYTRQVILSVILIFVIVVALILFRNYRQKNQSNLALAKQKEKLEQTLSDLQAAQSQLIQSEKMASLGELTAGIAHEIQNPLNFVNNFSEVNKELLAEMEEALNKENFQEARLLAKDIIENQDKINFHGKRADSIVKSMLQHSRTNSGKRELTDINALCDEYLRLAYHGYRAKDKLFNARFETEFDTSLPKINVIPQDIGRVVLNLINNAFYAVNERQKQNIQGYEPTVTVRTALLSPAGGGKGVVHISVKDNGPGIPDSIKEKIFQPFFTTKPTGQGTGLGLSLSYDIVKAHGGELKVVSQPARAGTEGEGSEFIIQL
jgi:signal transduction histidine kinase